MGKYTDLVEEVIRNSGKPSKQCRIGITTDPIGRENYWESVSEGFSNWEILAEGLSREEAQKMEDELSNEQGCVAHGGGDDSDDPNDTYSVYRFEFTKDLRTKK